MASTKRAHVVLPEDLVRQIDKIAARAGGAHFSLTWPSGR
jgi:hypothetical protein